MIYFSAAALLAFSLRIRAGLLPSAARACYSCNIGADRVYPAHTHKPTPTRLWFRKCGSSLNSRSVHFARGVQ